MDERHSLLKRQIKKHLNGKNPFDGECLAFLEAVDAAYKQFDEDRNMLERSLDLSSHELLDANASLRQMKDALEARVAERTFDLESTNDRLRSELDERRRLEERLLLSQKLEAVGRLAGGVAHDFNNLLTAIMGYGDFLVAALEKDPLLSSYIQEVQKASQKAAALTQQLLAFGRKQHLNPVVLNLNDLVMDLGKMLQRVIGENIEIATIPSPNLWSVKADAGQIDQVIMNLVVNARDAMPHGGNIRVETRNVELKEPSRHAGWEIPAGAYVSLSVADTGTGMDEEVKARIFEPFFTTKEKGKGTGLGLATVYGVVKQSGGYIMVESSPGKGSVFSIFFPSGGAAVPRPKAEPSPPGAGGGSELVLLVEDENAVRALTRRILEGNGYKVLEARYGDEALRVSENNPEPIDLLMTDVVMPGMSGHELANRLIPLRPEMKILFMSGYTDDISGPGNGRGKPPAFLPKPFLPQDVLRAVRRALDA